jgi:hypothetical protein
MNKKLFLCKSVLIAAMCLNAQLIMGAGDETVIAEENLDGSYWFDDEGTGAICVLTAEGVAITNPQAQEEFWKPQTQVLKDAKLQKNHSYKVIVTAKIPKNGELQIQLGTWRNSYIEDKPFPVKSSNDFQTFEVDFMNFPVDAEDGHVLFQNGGIVGTSIVQNAQILDITNSEEIIAERDWTAPYWFKDEGIGATYEMTADGLAITIPKIQKYYWTPQTQILQCAKLQKNHSYKVIVTTKIPSDGVLQVQLGTWTHDNACIDQSLSVNASDKFQSFEFTYQNFPVDAEDGHVLFQNGGIAGTCIVKKVQIIEVSDIWTIAGDGNLLGTEWDIASLTNIMTTQDSKLYTLTKNNLTLQKGTYHFKVFKNATKAESYPNSDATLVINEDAVYTVKFTFNSNTKELSAMAYKVQSDGFETAAEAVMNMKIGWNLFNTLDALVDADWFTPENYEIWETAWGQAVTKPELIKMIRKIGFNTIRVPVTWYLHMDSSGKVNPMWMKRVHEIVDYVIDQGLYCILNTHHETVDFQRDDKDNIIRYPKIMADKTNYNENKEWFEELWRQIAEEFKDYDEHLLFEGYNEPRDKYESWVIPNNEHGPEHVEQAYQAINNYAQSFVTTVRSTGGNNIRRNLIVNTYSACTGPDDSHAESFKQLKLPNDVTDNHILFGIHVYWMENNDDVDAIINNVKEHITSRGIPTIVSEWGAFNEGGKQYKDFYNYFIQQTKANNIATILWGSISDALTRIPPFIHDPDKAKAIMKAYYGDRYEPIMQTKEDYDFKGIKVSFDHQDAGFDFYNDGRNKSLSLTEYKGIRIELENADGLMVKIQGSNNEQYNVLSSLSETIIFNKSVVGDFVKIIHLQNIKDGKNDTKILNAYLIKKDGTEEQIEIVDYFFMDPGCKYELIMPRKKEVRSFVFNNRQNEFNVFYDKVPLKMKNYKGMRIELAEPLNNTFHIKIYGDEESKTDVIGLTGISTTFTFNIGIFSSEVNRITLFSDIKDKYTAKIIGAYLIRQDNTEEYCDLGTFIIKGDLNNDSYVNSADISIIADLIMKSRYNARADVNGDNKVNATDIVTVTNEIK